MSAISILFLEDMLCIFDIYKFEKLIHKLKDNIIKLLMIPTGAKI